ncbi:unnamed protein product [Kuraishia capsulata CBS 1993]|uniref:Multifunctional methyltransferase subunit trm112 n=1 Tax=Kuraishia capsulata CBS 1993 TaxID=1382522 RepID=W6MPS9_9ASCO|nr:uncharacterized protein KUCA_T00003154001 [Kuraishia capsulata CBS 1993]CDK27177.1 unnamed protein product [Kuraishia capsulata CBS 1993]
MKFLTTNFVRCAVKSCAASSDSFPLVFSECQLVQQEQDFDAEFLTSMLDRLDWPALIKVAADLGNNSIPQVKPENIDPEDPESERILRDLHSLLLETQITEGKMICNHCQHVYYIKNSVANFLLPPHLAN